MQHSLPNPACRVSCYSRVYDHPTIYRCYTPSSGCPGHSIAYCPHPCPPIRPLTCTGQIPGCTQAMPSNCHLPNHACAQQDGDRTLKTHDRGTAPFPQGAGPLGRLDPTNRWFADGIPLKFFILGGDRELREKVSTHGGLIVQRISESAIILLPPPGIISPEVAELVVSEHKIHQVIIEHRWVIDCYLQTARIDSLPYQIPISLLRTIRQHRGLSQKKRSVLRSGPSRPIADKAEMATLARRNRFLKALVSVGSKSNSSSSGDEQRSIRRSRPLKLSKAPITEPTRNFFTDNELESMARYIAKFWPAKRINWDSFQVKHPNRKVTAYIQCYHRRKLLLRKMAVEIVKEKRRDVVSPPPLEEVSTPTPQEYSSSSPVGWSADETRGGSTYDDPGNGRNILQWSSKSQPVFRAASEGSNRDIQRIGKDSRSEPLWDDSNDCCEDSDPEVVL